MRHIDGPEVRRRLTYDVCIPLVREAMIAFSAGHTRQLLRSLIPLAEGNVFGIMPGAMADDGPFGAKLISVYPGNFDKGRSSHQGLVVLFDPSSGAPVCVVDAAEVTAIRTAAASAVATDALARPDSSRLALLGYGDQAAQHLTAIAKVRPIVCARVWGRRSSHAADFAKRMAAQSGIEILPAESAADAVAGADIICTLTPATEPILEGAWVKPGAHVNLVGAGHAGQTEADTPLVAASRFFVDSREGVLAQGGEFLRAKAAGAIGDSHIVAEIGDVLAGSAAGRNGETEITVYKSLGHVVQDLASAWALYAVSAPPGG